ncbi:MAG TPA: LamG-like jellyroll fold domain-containing protein, partial [Spirochaetia bacterium]
MRIADMTVVRKKHLSGALLVCLALVSVPVFALEKTIELGRQARWGDLVSMDGVQAVAGRWGYQDLVLTSGAYTADPATELLLHFDAPSTTDATGGYTISGAAPSLQGSVAAVGGASAAFNGSRQGVKLQAPPNGMFAVGAAWEDFSIEFWLYPSTLSDGEIVLSWTGSARKSGSLLGQSFHCLLRGRRLVWDFQNLFTLPGSGAYIPVTLSGTRQLLPRAWHHHLLRYDSRTGLLEYRIDGVPEAITHVTDTGSETGSIATAAVGLAYSGPLVLGQGFTGFLDELRVSRRLVDDAVLTRYLGRTGTATSRILDLGNSSTRVARIEAVTSTPGDTAVEFFYQVADAWNGKKTLGAETNWVPFTPGTDFGDAIKARYLQIRI